MLRLVLHFIPSGNIKGDIYNIGSIVTGNKNPEKVVCDYDFKISTAEIAFGDKARQEAFNIEGEIKSHYRPQNVWQLFRRILNENLPEYIQPTEEEK